MLVREDSGADALIESIAAELREALLELRQRPARAGGRKVVVHIAENWSSALIELPPEIIRIGR
jgi:hypothetical protein